jgi:hypothetical protein
VPLKAHTSTPRAIQCNQKIMLLVLKLASIQ